MRYWGKNIQIDATFYTTEHGQSLIPTTRERQQMVATGNPFAYEGNVQIYEATIQNMMRQIAGNPVGGLLIDAINRSDATLRIIPLTSKEQSPRLKRIPCANRVGAFSPEGNDCVIWFEPWSRLANITGGGNSPQQVLVHELQHALRQMRGRYHPTGPVGGFPNAEELFSVTIENMYLSAEKQPQKMVGAYNQNIPLNGRGDRDWYKQYGNELEVWCKQVPDLTVQFETMSSFWNPISVRRDVLDFIIRL